MYDVVYGTVFDGVYMMCVCVVWCNLCGPTEIKCLFCFFVLAEFDLDLLDQELDKIGGTVSNFTLCHLLGCSNPPLEQIT